MQDWAKLLQAIASLAWPILSFIALIIFHRDIGALITRLRRGKVFGQEFELEKSLNELNESANLASVEIPVSVSTKETNDTDISRERQHIKQDEDLLDEASRSPKVALITLSSDMERELRQLLAGMELYENGRPLSFRYMIELLDKRGALPTNVTGSVKHFSEIRNRIVHGHEASQDDIIRAVDSGLTILRSIRSIPHEINTVYHPGTEVFSDPKGKTLREGIKAVVLKTTSPGKSIESLRVFPTKRNHFIKGKQVAWEWNMDLKVNESWYRNPDNKKIEHAWWSSAEFIGRNIKDV